MTDANQLNYPAVVATNGQCDSFTCLTAQGLSSWCTQTCTYKTPASGAKACQADSDCTAPLHCYQNFCNDDSCPAGFTCRAPNPGTPDKLYCQRSTCTKVNDCEDVDKFACVLVGCYDVCLETPGSCAGSQATCKARSKLTCTCSGGAASCADGELQCTIGGTVQPAGAVRQTSLCLPQ